MATTNEELMKMFEQQTASAAAAQQAAIDANKQEAEPIEQPTTNAAAPSVSAANGTVVTNSATNSASAQRGTSQSQGQSIHSQSGNSTTTTRVGDLTPEQKAELEQRIAAVNQGNNIRLNPETGQYEYIDPNQTTLGTVLPGLRKNAEEAERINYSRSLGSALYNSLQALADMGIAIGGGNVYKRELDKTGIEAAKDTQARKDKLAEQEAAARQRDADLLRAAADNAEKLRERFDAMRERVSSTNSNSAGVTTDNRTTNTESRSSSSSRSAGTQQLKGGGTGRSGGGSGGGSKYSMVIDITGKDGKHTEHDLTESEYKDIQGVLISRYKQLLENGTDEQKTAAEKWLREHHIIDSSGEWNYDQIMRNGRYYGLTDADVNMIREKTNNKVSFPNHNQGYNPDAKKTTEGML